jgi:lysozyme family protein
MAKLTEDFLQHVAKFEGGLSADPRDNAESFSSNYLMKSGKFKGLPVHTNKGVTYQTWVTYARKKGFTPTGDNFVAMTKAQWFDIAKTLYWDYSWCDRIDSQGVAEILFEARWGGGFATMMGDLQRYLNLKGAKPTLVVDRAIGKNSVAAINEFTKNVNNEKDLIRYLTDKRLEYLKTLGDWSWAGNGWTNRVKRMLDRGLAMAGGTAAGISIVGLLAISAIVYTILKK